MKKMIKFVLHTVVVLTMLGIVGCGGDSPDSIAEKYVDCLEDADFESMRQMSTGDMIQRIDRAERRYAEVAKLLGEKEAKKVKSTYDDLKYEIGAAGMSDDAKIVIQIKINGQDTPMTLIKQGENWRIEKFEFPII